MTERFIHNCRSYLVTRRSSDGGKTLLGFQTSTGGAVSARQTTIIFESYKRFIERTATWPHDQRLRAPA